MQMDRMTDEYVREAFDAVYNRFWLRWKNRGDCLSETQWDEIDGQMKTLTKNYPVLRDMIVGMVSELDFRSRERSSGEGKGK